MQTRELSNKSLARFTGWMYFLVFLTGIYGFFYVNGKIYVHGDIAATADKMLTNESLFRSGIVTGLIGNILFVTVVIFLYQLLKQVNELIARLMKWFVLIAMPVSFITDALDLTALFIFKGDLLKSFPAAQSREIAATLLDIDNNIGQLVTFHWGLWLLPLGWLIYKSGFIPKLFGVLLWINGFGYMIASLSFMLWPDSISAVSKIVMPTYFMGELPLMFWLLIKGVKRKEFFASL